MPKRECKAIVHMFPDPFEMINLDEEESAKIREEFVKKEGNALKKIDAYFEYWGQQDNGGYRDIYGVVTEKRTGRVYLTYPRYIQFKM